LEEKTILKKIIIKKDTKVVEKTILKKIIIKKDTKVVNIILTFRMITIRSINKLKLLI